MRGWSALVAACLLATSAVAHAAPPQAASRAEREVDALIAALGASQCEFQRNGRWYPADDAQAHLRRKYDWLARRGMVASAEQFIARAGTESSTTGRAYAVRCPGRPVESSAAWLTRRLQASRAPPAP